MTVVTSGFYRFTDIFFEWHQVLPKKEDIGPLKALIGYDALVHPDHPLRKEGVDGIELYVGTFESGEARLLFSSEQIEYMRYWLHAMKLTEEPLPLPSGDFLITRSSLRSCSPAVYSNASAMKKAVRVIEKNNKKLRGAEPLLTSRRLGFERTRALWSEKVGRWLSIDIEAWDRDHTLLTEFGWSLIRWEDGEEINEMGHLVVKERRSYYNTYVPNNKNNYNFGKSEDVDKNAFKDRIHDIIAQNRAIGPLFLVFHDSSQDIKYLRSNAINAPLTNLTYLFPDSTPTEGLYVIDTAELFAALEGVSGSNTRGLQQMCRHLRIPVEFLHNAGNDAHYTMLALKSMASGDPVDEQRQKRWPDRISSIRPKVEFQPIDEDSDYISDDEFPTVANVVQSDDLSGTIEV